MEADGTIRYVDDVDNVLYLIPDDNKHGKKKLIVFDEGMREGLIDFQKSFVEVSIVAEDIREIYDGGAKPIWKIKEFKKKKKTDRGQTQLHFDKKGD